MLPGGEANALVEDAAMLLEKCVAATPKATAPLYYSLSDVLMAVQIVQLNRIESALCRANDLTEGR